MSEGRTATGAGHRGGSGTTRLVRAWRVLPHESRLAAGASVVLFLTLFLPWYQVTLIAPAKAAKLESASATITGWGAFSFVEAAILLVAAGVLILLFQRAEGRAFHLPGGDGGVIAAAGVWACVLIVWRIFDKQGATTNGPSATSSGVEWGIFVALATAAFLAYAGSRIRAAHRPEPPLPGEDRAPAGSSAASAEDRPRRPDTPAPQRRRERSSRPVAGDRTDRVRAADPPPAPASPPHPDRPRRRRATAAEMFERVVPDDPPTMPFGRAKRSDVDLTTRMPRSVEPAPRDDPTPVGEQLTIPPRGGEDPAHQLGEDATLQLGEDATIPLGGDATIPPGGDATLPVDAGDTLSLDANDTLTLGEDATRPLDANETLPLGEDATLPLDERPKRH